MVSKLTAAIDLWDQISIMMGKRKPIAFLSYVHGDDEHDGGNITKFRQRLEGEIKMQLGSPFPIFQDRNDIEWGQQWEARITQSLLDVTFLIPIITPSFFNSPACKSEVIEFYKKEQQLGFNHLILPLYYVTCDEIENSSTDEMNEVVAIINGRQWTDWRDHRNRTFTDERVSKTLTEMAVQVKFAMQQLEEELSAEENAREEALKKAKLLKLTRAKKSPHKRKPKTKKKKETQVSIKPTKPFSVDLLEVRLNGVLNLEALSEIQKSPYFVYTREFDEVINAEDLVSGRSENNFLKQFNNLMFENKDQSQLEELPLPYTAAVTLLLDNSGSLRGEGILQLALTAADVMRWLESEGIEVEVLGFTTRAWRGGQSRETWQGDGMPKQPGRLNDLRHIIYKDFNQSSQNALPNFELMMREGILKENIDGEALLWANQRIADRHVSKRLIITFSDGTPVDDSTLVTNRNSFLDEHLRYVIKHIEDETTTNLLSVGYMYDTSDYYRRSFPLHPEDSRNKIELKKNIIKLLK